MPPPSPEVAHLRAKIANRARFRPDDPELAELRRELRVVELVERFEQVITDRPPLSGAQRAKLAILLEPARDVIYADYLADPELDTQLAELEQAT